MTYGCKFMVLLTLCRFLDYPVHTLSQKYPRHSRL